MEQALRRELEEELGITIASASVWKVTEHDYPACPGALALVQGSGSGAASLKCAKANPWPGRRFPSPWSLYCQGPTLFSIGWSRSSFLDLLLIFGSCWRLWISASTTFNVSMLQARVAVLSVCRRRFCGHAEVFTGPGAQIDLFCSAHCKTAGSGWQGCKRCLHRRSGTPRCGPLLGLTVRYGFCWMPCWTSSRGLRGGKPGIKRTTSVQTPHRRCRRAVAHPPLASSGARRQSGGYH